MESSIILIKICWNIWNGGFFNNKNLSLIDLRNPLSKSWWNAFSLLDAFIFRLVEAKENIFYTFCSTYMLLVESIIISKMNSGMMLVW